MNDYFEYVPDIMKFCGLPRLHEPLLYEIGNSIPFGSFRVDTVDLDKLLKTKFGIDIETLMKVYSMKRCGFSFCVPIAENTVLSYSKAAEASEIQAQLNAWGLSTQMLISTPFGTQLNLHDVSIFKFNLIESQEALSEVYHQLSGGFYHTSGKYDFWVRSSSQGDMFVVYSERRKVEA